MEIKNDNDTATKICISQIIAGYCFRGGDIMNVLNILRSVADDYEKEIKNEITELNDIELS